jgi:hypothetical protein
LTTSPQRYVRHDLAEGKGRRVEESDAVMSAMLATIFGLALICIAAVAGTYGLMRQAGITPKQMRARDKTREEKRLEFMKFLAAPGPLVCPAGDTCDNAGCLEFGCRRAHRAGRAMPPDATNSAMPAYSQPAAQSA